MDSHGTELIGQGRVSGAEVELLGHGSEARGQVSEGQLACGRVVWTEDQAGGP